MRDKRRDREVIKLRSNEVEIGFRLKLGSHDLVPSLWSPICHNV